MASSSTAQLFVLGNLAAAKGTLGAAHSRAADKQMAIATSIITDPTSYSHVDRTVVCVEDRLHRPSPRLAGGALSLALMRNLIHHEALLSDDLRELKALGFRLALHRDCGALNLAAAGFVNSELGLTVNPEGYKLLSALNITVPLSVRRRIANWARSLPTDYVNLGEASKFVDDIDDVKGQHNAVAASVSMEDGISFTGGPRLKHETGGLLSFAFDPWVVGYAARRIAFSPEDRAAVKALSLLFTAQVFLTLGGPDLKVAVHR